MPPTSALHQFNKNRGQRQPTDRIFVMLTAPIIRIFHLTLLIALPIYRVDSTTPKKGGPMVSLKVFNSVGKELRRIEQAYDVRVLYACESGSRAWGFASQDSDYDVRFLYVHSRDWYLSIEDRRDVIEQPLHEGLDLSGWDLRKTLQLLRKSNPPLL